MSELSVAKKKLSECLGDGMELYLQNLKSWFKQKISKEEFDFQARRMLPADSANLHNEFLLAMFTKCQHIPIVKDLPSPTVKKTVPKSAKVGHTTRASFQHRFTPVKPLSYAPQATVMSTDGDVSSLSFCSRDLALPDSLVTHGRMFVTAWENGLEDVDSVAVALVVKAVECHLKNIVATVLSARNGYKLREGRFRYALGTPAPNPYLRHTVTLGDYADSSEATSVTPQGLHVASIRPSPDVGEEDAVRRLACVTHEPSPKLPVSLFDLFTSLQLYKSAIPSHAIYATNIERIIHAMWHPGNEDGQQDRQKQPAKPSFTTVT